MKLDSSPGFVWLFKEMVDSGLRDGGAGESTVECW